MKYIPETQEALVLRTDFSDSASWESICATIREPVRYLIGEFQAYVDFISDLAFDGITPDQVLSLIPQGARHSFMFLVDRIALTNPDHPILVVDLYTEPGCTFRVIPSEMSAVENNLSLANMDFAEFADATDPDGVFRGFR